MTHVLSREQILPRQPDEVFGFFADAFNLEAITPAVAAVPSSHARLPGV